MLNMKSRAATRTIQILEVISKEPKGLSLSEIANVLDIPVTSTNDIVKALVDEGVVELVDERSKLYGIGIKAYVIGSNYIANTSLIDKARPIIEELSETTNRTVFLGKEVNGKITYLYKHEPRNPLVATCGIGSRTSLHSTSLGKSFLAYEHDLLESLRGEELVQETPYSITNYDKLVSEVKKVRIQGCAVDDREQNDHLLCFGAPVFDHNRNIIAAISTSGLYREDIDWDEQFKYVKEAALAISVKLGYK